MDPNPLKNKGEIKLKASIAFFRNCNVKKPPPHMAFEYGTGCLFIPLHLHSHLFMVPSQTAPSSHHLNLKHHMEDRLFSFIQNRPTFVGQHEIIPISSPCLHILIISGSMPSGIVEQYVSDAAAISMARSHSCQM